MGEGYRLSRQQLIDALCELGVERFGAQEEPFDPARHEALFYDTRPDVTERTVGTVIRPGYRLGDRLLRPARVSVIGPSEESSESETEQQKLDRAAKTNK